MNLLIPILSRTPSLCKELRKILPKVNFHEVENPDKDLHFKKSEILICDFDLLGPYLYDLPHVKWVQGTWAGIDKLIPLIQKDKLIPFQITRFTGTHFGRIMSEYIVATIVNHERNLHQVQENQKTKQWSREGKISDYRIIADLKVGILGIGNIGNRIGQTLNSFGATILAMGRRPSLPTDDEYRHISKYYTKDTLPSLLKECDYIINVLPSTNETNDLLNKDILQNCSEKQSILINIGRSNIISEDEIIKAVKNKWLSAVILDVFDTEPLPEDSLLWTTEQVFITPHVSGMSRSKDIAEQFKSNLNLYLNNLPLPAKIDFEKGY